jgi:hypothetical protein
MRVERGAAIHNKGVQVSRKLPFLVLLGLLVAASVVLAKQPPPPTVQIIFPKTGGFDNANFIVQGTTTPVPPPQGAVVWVRFYDANNNVQFIGQVQPDKNGTWAIAGMVPPGKDYLITATYFSSVSVVDGVLIE